MMNKKNILDFLNFGYKPLTKKYIIQNLFITWFLSLLVAFVCFNISALVYGIIITNIIITIFLLFFIKKKAKQFIKFLFDGINFTYLSILLLLGSFLMFTYHQEKKLWIFLFMLLIWLINVFICVYICLRNVKNDNYKAHKGNKNIFLYSLMASGIAVILSRVFLSNLNQDFVPIILAIVLIVLSLLLSVCSINFLKVFYYFKIYK